jgi:hypothetical protein
MPLEQAVGPFDWDAIEVASFPSVFSYFLAIYV